MPKYSNTLNKGFFRFTVYQRKSNLFFDFSVSPCCGSVTYTPLCFVSRCWHLRTGCKEKTSKCFPFVWKVICNSDGVISF